MAETISLTLAAAAPGAGRQLRTERRDPLMRGPDVLWDLGQGSCLPGACPPTPTRAPMCLVGTEKEPGVHGGLWLPEALGGLSNERTIVLCF